jgi:hypothetical protein
VRELGKSLWRESLKMAAIKERKLGSSTYWGFLDDDDRSRNYGENISYDR